MRLMTGVAVLMLAGLLPLDPPRVVHAQSVPMPQQAAGRGFTVSVPAGYTALKEGPARQVMEAGGMVLAVPPGAPGFRASIVIVAVSSPVQGDLGAATVCNQLAEGASANGAREIKSRKIITASWGPACQFELAEKSQPNRGAIGTFAYRGTVGWMITCNLDPKDERARAACHEVVRSWKFSS